MPDGGYKISAYIPVGTRAEDLDPVPHPVDAPDSDDGPAPASATDPKDDTA
jgi:hypothetical protein